MKHTGIAVMMSLLMAGPVLAGQGAMGTPMENPSQAAGSGGRLLVTHPRGDVETPETRARKYRSCLFAYLPRIGSDVAAEIIRDACAEEYLTDGERAQ
ncbi:MAG TPA: hypothetical protein ENK48_00360 [Gammaproteobacteria bacterium]|nr:hypothetical protein [Gammaproteobacteria bacterium]